MLPILRIRSHTKTCQLAYYERLEPYLERVGLLPVVLQFKHVPLVVNHATDKALLHHWQPGTHCFHLPSGEMTITLGDFMVITGLPLHSESLTGRVCNKFGHERVTSLISGCSPSLTLRKKTNDRTSAVPFKWLCENRSGCPQGAEDETWGSMRGRTCGISHLMYFLHSAPMTLRRGCILTS